MSVSISTVNPKSLFALISEDATDNEELAEGEVRGAPFANCEGVTVIFSANGASAAVSRAIGMIVLLITPLLETGP